MVAHRQLGSHRCNNSDYGLKWMSGLVHIPNAHLPATFNTATGACSWLSSKPWVAGRVPGVMLNGAVTPHARNGLQLFTCTRTGVGDYEVSWTTPHPSGIEYSVHLSTSMYGFGIYSTITPTSVKFEFYSVTNVVQGIMNPSQNINIAEDPGQFSFLTVP